MTKVSTSTQLAGHSKPWRYIALDKLIDLLSSHELFFSPLASFVRSDPYEGYSPAVAYDAMSSIYKPLVEDTSRIYSQLKAHCEAIGLPLTADEQSALIGKIADLRSAPRLFHDAITKAIAVNCWHSCESESEALWRLYGDNGKSVALETTLDDLARSIAGRESPYSVQIYPVKYLDFFDMRLTPKDCMVEGRRAPLLKRISYQHEREVRAFIVREAATPREGSRIEHWTPLPLRIPVDLVALIKAIHISPYASEPFPGSVKAICKKFDVKDDAVQLSRLLSGHEELLNRLSL